MLNQQNAVVIDEKHPSAALGSLALDKATKDELLATEADAKKRIELWKARCFCDRGLVFLGEDPRWPQGNAEFAKATDDLGAVQATMLGLGYACLLLHDETLGRQASDHSDHAASQLAGRASDEHRRSYQSILFALEAGGVTR
jgi:hypothetical protein